MSVYIDDMYKYPIGQFGRMKMSHMVADSSEELLAMADTIGVARRWIQHAGTDREHFDVSLSHRAKAVAAGAIEVTMRELCRRPWSRGQVMAVMAPFADLPESPKRDAALERWSKA